MPALAGILQTLAGQQDADDPDADMKKQLRDLPQLKQAKREELDYLFIKYVEYREEAEAMGIGMCTLNYSCISGCNHQLSFVVVIFLASSFRSSKRPLKVP